VLDVNTHRDALCNPDPREDRIDRGEPALRRPCSLMSASTGAFRFGRADTR